MTTNYDDLISVGYNQDDTATDNYGNFSSAANLGDADGAITDGTSQLATIDLADGNDVLKVRGTQSALTRAYLGEGDDKYYVGGDISGGNIFVFAESGNDLIDIGGNLGSADVYAGSGSDNIIVGGDLSGKLDLGSGQEMPASYLPTYNDGTTPLGSDDNTDLATDINTVNVTGNVSGDIIGGIGSDTIDIEGFVEGSASLSTGDGNDAINIISGLNNNAIVDTGAGDDTVNISGTMGDGIGSATVRLGDGNDTLTYDGTTTNLAGNEIALLDGGLGLNDVFDVSQANAQTGYIDYTLIDGFETIILGDTYNKNLLFNGSGGLRIDSSDLSSDNVDTLKIDGTSASVVDLGNDFSLDSSDVSQAGYNAYINSSNSEVIYISTEITNII